MKHQNKLRKLNVSFKHRKALLRNQMIHFILHGKLCTTIARIKEVKREIEKLVTIARKGNHYNVRRAVAQRIPYSKPAQEKLMFEIAPTYVSRPGGYTRLVHLHRRISDTAEVGVLSWVDDAYHGAASIQGVTTVSENQTEKLLTV